MRRTKTNIVLRAKSEPSTAIPKLFLGFRAKENKGAEKKVKIKPIQKESRNVYSNILRIFFKCLLEMQTYDALIQTIILKLNLSITKEDFCTWLLGFNINFKNYIRGTQIKKLLTAAGCIDHKKILVILLRDYLYKHAVSHCLTSKRIELSSLKMHLSGLKELYQEIMEMKRQFLWFLSIYLCLLCANYITAREKSLKIFICRGDGLTFSGALCWGYAIYCRFAFFRSRKMIINHQLNNNSELSVLLKEIISENHYLE